jgi:hypothetical protein
VTSAEAARAAGEISLRFADGRIDVEAVAEEKDDERDTDT